MTKVQNNIQNAIFDSYLGKAKLEVLSDISFAYRFENENLVIDFYQDEIGKNHLDELAVKHNDIRFPIIASDYQLKAMWHKLNSTSLAFDTIVEEDPITDLYDYFGVQPSNFY